MLYQPNRCALLESALDPGQTVIFDRLGKMADGSSVGYVDLSKEFVVFVKVIKTVVQVYLFKILFVLFFLCITFILITIG